MGNQGFADRIVVAVAIAAGVVLLPLVVVAIAVRALLAPFVDLERSRRWHRTPGLTDLVPGKPRWDERELRVAGLVSALQALPVERFDTFYSGAFPDRMEIQHACDGAPQSIQNAVGIARVGIRHAVEGRCERERPDAGYEDYSIHLGGVWELSDPHWIAAERVAEAGATALLLDGYLPGPKAARWIEGAARLVE